MALSVEELEKRVKSLESTVAAHEQLIKTLGVMFPGIVPAPAPAPGDFFKMAQSAGPMSLADKLSMIMKGGL